jgi:hypothetical protein
MNDLINVEKCLRAMYHTADGATCQAMMTMEYQCWRRNVIRKILCNSKQNMHVQQDDFKDNHTLSNEWPKIQAILSGFKIVFVNNMCHISQILPGSYVQTWKQDNAQATVDKNLRQEDCTNVFKKHKTCRSLRQV